MTPKIVAFTKLGQSPAFDLAIEGYSTLVGWGHRPLTYPTPESEGLVCMSGKEAVSVVLFHTDLSNQALVIDLIYTEQSSEGLGYAARLMEEAKYVCQQRNLQRLLITFADQDSKIIRNLLGKAQFKLLAEVWSQEIGS